jgi:hypothetical protein
VASPGRTFTGQVVVGESVDTVTQTLARGLSSRAGYSMTMAGNRSLLLQRRYPPTWTIVVATIFAILTVLTFWLIGPLFLFGLLVLLVRQTETLSINVSEARDGTEVRTSGIATEELIASVQSILAALDLQPASPSSRALPDRLPDPNGVNSDDYKTCPKCAERIRGAARVCRYCGHRFADLEGKRDSVQ